MILLLSLRHKIYLALASLVLLLGLMVALFVKLEFSEHLRLELEKRAFRSPATSPTAASPRFWRAIC